MSKEIFELPAAQQPLDTKEKKEIQLEPVEKSEVKSEEVKDVKVKRVRKVIDNETRELLLDKLKKSRKIKELTAESNELKAKLEKLESVPIVKQEPVVKKTITRKIKTIEEPIKKMEEIKRVPLVESVKVHLEVPKKVVHSTYRQPIW